MLAPPRPAIDRFDLRQFMWENILDMVELVSFLDTAKESLVLLLVGGLRFRGVKKA
jgi:hypothetical protein